MVAPRADPATPSVAGAPVTTVHKADAAPAVITPAAPAPVASHPAAPPSYAPPSFGARYLDNPKPAYPMLARRRGLEGTVRLEVRVSAEGIPTAVKVRESAGHEALDEAAMTAVWHWRFVPAGAEARRSRASLWCLSVSGWAMMRRPEHGFLSSQEGVTAAAHEKTQIVFDSAGNDV
jgi:TonB family protein